MTTTKPRLGRPPLPVGTAHRTRWALRLSAEDVSRLSRLAELMHCSEAEAVRKAVVAHLARLEAAEGRRKR